MRNLAEVKTGTWSGWIRSGVGVRHPGVVTSQAVAWWQVLLCGVALLNVALWSVSAAAVMRAPSVSAAAAAACRVQLVLAALYVVGCAYRSVLPVYDVPRIVLVDSRLSSVLIGRSVATVAELCFAAQWAVMLHRIAVLSHSPFGAAVAWAIVPLIVVAELGSWYSVLTTQQRGHILENSLWGVAAVLLVTSLLLAGSERALDLSALMIVWSVGGAAYAGFLFFIDVPMYWSRWQADRAAGRRYLKFAPGSADAWQRRIVSYRWEDWKGEMLWMSLYFTFGVWSSLSLIYAALTLGART
jgi:hypothetical protein